MSKPKNTNDILLAKAIFESRHFEKILNLDINTHDHHTVVITSVGDKNINIDISKEAIGTVMSITSLDTAKPANIIAMVLAIKKLLPNSSIKIDGGELIDNLNK